MTFGQAIQHVLSNYANFEGRASRSEFWWFFLFYVLVQFIGGVIDLSLFPNTVGLVGTLATLALLLPFLAVSARRLHDIGRSGWWQLISFVPLIGAVVLIFFFAQPSESESNRFGPPTTDQAVISA